MKEMSQIGDDSIFTPRSMKQLFKINLNLYSVINYEGNVPNLGPFNIHVMEKS